MSLAGKVLYHTWHRPVGAFRDCLRDGGPLQMRRTEKGRREMEKAASTLPLLPPGQGDPIEIHYLTGSKYWYQTAFCLWTLARTTGRPLRPVLHDDGTLQNAQSSVITNLFPETFLDTTASILERLNRALPTERFPSLRSRRIDFPLLRKLTDIHAGSSGWKLVLDSDLLFFGNPSIITAWYDKPDRPLRGEDIGNAYGYPLSMLNELAQQPVPERVNTGTLGLRSDDVDWQRLEFWCRELLSRGGTQYYQEQALTALLLAGKTCTIPPPDQYVLRPLPPEAIACKAVMHHYVAESKRWYFQNAWRTAIAQ